MKATIKVFHIYNLGFFGGNREGKLTGYVSCKYVDHSPVNRVFKTVVHEEVSGHSFFHPRKFETLKAKKAYEYNTRLTYL